MTSLSQAASLDSDEQRKGDDEDTFYDLDACSHPELPCRFRVVPSKTEVNVVQRAARPRTATSAPRSRAAKATASSQVRKCRAKLGAHSFHVAATRAWFALCKVSDKVPRRAADSCMLQATTSCDSACIMAVRPCTLQGWHGPGSTQTTACRPFARD